MINPSIMKLLGATILGCVLAIGVVWYAKRDTTVRIPVFDRSYSILEAHSKPRARIYLFGTINILSGPELGQALASKGFEVVYLGVPVIDPGVFRGDGLEYRKALTQGLESILAEIAFKRGPMRTVIGGGSIGGLNAMIAFSAVKRFDAWFAVLPVTKLSALNEMKGVDNPKYFDPFREIDAFRNSTGFMSWGTADERVNFHLSQDLYRAIESPRISYVEYKGLAHTSSEVQIADVVGWLDRTM